MRGPSAPSRDNKTVSQKVVDAVAEAEDIDPRDVTPPLNEVVDPETLDRMFALSTGSGPMNGNVTFSYSGHGITVGENGEVMVYSDIVH